MLSRNSILSLSLSLCWHQSCRAQFGVAGNRRKGGGAEFEELQRRASVASGRVDGAGLELEDLAATGDLQKLLSGAFSDPEMTKQYEAAMEEMAKMSPEELQNQMQDALKLLSGGDMLEQVVKNKDAVIANLEATGAVSVEELAMYRADDDYFAKKMQESFGEMQEIFNDPDYLQHASAAMNNVAEAIKSPDKLLEGIARLSEGMSDEDIEIARLKLLKGELSDDSMFGALFEDEDMKAILHDSEKWRAAVKEGRKQMVDVGGSGSTSKDKDEL